MTSPEKRKIHSKSQEDIRKINQELPYFIAIITLMASSGISPFMSLKKIIHLDLLQNMSKEAKRMIRQIENLGMDPLTVMNKRASETLSNQYSDFLSGYVSTVQSGGSVVHFLKSKMDSIFDVQGAIAKELVVRLSALVDGYMIIQVVILTMYIIFIVISATPSLAVSILPDSKSTTNLFYIFLMIPPLLSGSLMFIAHQMTTSTCIGTERILKKNLLLTLIVVPIVIVVSLVLPQQHTWLPYFLAVALLTSSIISFSGYVKIEKMNSTAERVTPSILRNIAESRRTGLSPERCIIDAFKKGKNGVFSSTLDRAVNQMQWGMPLKTIIDHIRKDVSSWFVLINFRMLVEIIESGGGHAEALDTLASSSEKMYNVEKMRRTMLSPYIVIAFLITGITGFTTLLVIDSFTGLSQSVDFKEQIQYATTETQSMREMFAASIVFQAHLVGLFIGKIVSGTFVTGLKYSIMLTTIVLLSIAVADFAPIDINMMFAPSNTSGI